MKKLLTLLLALAMILPILASCGDETEESKATSHNLGEGWWDELDFGKELTIAYPKDGSFGAQCNIYSEEYQRGPTQIGADDVKNLCYNRNQDVCAALGITAKYLDPKDGISMDTWSVMATGAPDLVYIGTNELDTALLKGQFYNVHSTDDVNYFDFSADCWYQGLMDSFTLDSSKHYGVAGDFFLSIMQAANCLYMNTDYYETNLSSYMSLDELVDVIEARVFTGEEFVNLIEYGWVPTGSDSKAKVDDGVGLLAHTSTWLYPFIYSVDDYVFTKDSKGEVQMVETANKLYDIIEEVIDIYNADGTLVDQYGDSSSANATEYIDRFTAGNALFVEGLTVGDMHDNRLLSMEKKIAIPYPILNPTQTEYITYVSMQAQLGSILKNTKSFSACTAFLQLLNEQSTSIVDEYFGYTLKFKNTTDPTGMNMLDILHDTIGSIFNKIMSDNVKNYSGQQRRIIYFVIESVTANQNKGITEYAKVVDAYKSGLAELKKVFAALD